VKHWGGTNVKDGATSSTSTAGVTSSISKLPLRKDTVPHIGTNVRMSSEPKH
jgi:hypothetical protein